MATVCPAILAPDKESYRQEMERIGKEAHRIQVDLTDGMFTASKTIGAGDAWWPAGVSADFHLMYKNPLPAARVILKHQAHMIIVHAEAEGSFDEIADFCHQAGVKVGVALLPKTSPETILPALPKVEHVLIFSGDLGRYGGHADFSLLRKIAILKDHKPELEFGWDGGINDQNISQLVAGGVDVLNVGGFIQKAEDPGRALSSLQRIADETGTT